MASHPDGMGGDVVHKFDKSQFCLIYNQVKFKVTILGRIEIIKTVFLIRTYLRIHIELWLVIRVLCTPPDRFSCVKKHFHVIS